MRQSELPGVYSTISTQTIYTHMHSDLQQLSTMNNSIVLRRELQIFTTHLKKSLIWNESNIIWKYLIEVFLLYILEHVKSDTTNLKLYFI